MGVILKVGARRKAAVGARFLHFLVRSVGLDFALHYVLAMFNVVLVLSYLDVSRDYLLRLQLYTSSYFTLEMVS